MKARRIAANTLIYILLAVLSIIWLAPIVWLVLQSFDGAYGTASMAQFIPTSWTFDNYINLFNNKVVNAFGVLEPSYFNYGKWFLNTLIVAAVSCIVSTFLVLCTSYAFSRLRFKGRTGIMKAILILGMFPGFLSMIVVYNVLKMIGLQGTLFGLILCYIGGAGMGYYISKGFFDTISKTIDEAAMVDGANKWQIFYMIILPLSKPILIYTLLTSFMSPWGEYITASYILGGNPNNWTIAIGLFTMTDKLKYLTKYYHQFCAGSVVIAIPISLLFIFMQKYYVGGVTSGAVKG